MSRYELPLTPETVAARVATDLAIGWDAPLATYFLQLLYVDPDTDEITDVIWIGTNYEECQDVDHIIELASHYSAEARSHRDRLIADRERQGSRPRSPLLG